MKTLGILILTMALQLSAHAADRAGNGGDFNEMQFVTLAYENLDVLRILAKESAVPVDLNIYSQKLQSLRVNFVARAELPDGPRSAVNYPNEISIDVDQQLWQQNPERLSRLNLVLHEMLWISGVSDKGYTVSAPLFKKMKPLLLKHTSQASKTPVLLYANEMDNTTSGMDADTANQLCELQKEQYQDQYFFVYCVFYERTHHRIEMQPIDSVTQRLLISRGLIEAYRQDSWNSQPVSVTDKFYGLRVFGLGDADSLQWKVVASSLGLGGGLIDRTFESRIDAQIACHKRLSEEDRGSLKFSGAQCRVLQEDAGPFYYQIITKNPLVSVKE